MKPFNIQSFNIIYLMLRDENKGYEHSISSIQESYNAASGIAFDDDGGITELQLLPIITNMVRGNFLQWHPHNAYTVTSLGKAWFKDTITELFIKFIGER